MTENTKVPAQRWYRIIPVVIIMYVIAYVDRVNIGFAIASGMGKDLGMDAGIAGLAAGIFFVGYMLLQVPGGHIAEKGNAKSFVAYSIVGWGGLTILSAFVQNETQFLIVRFLLGVAEGGVWPAILAIIAHWFPSDELGRANAFCASTTSIGAIIAGPMAGIILQYWNWRELFIFQGALSLVLLVVWFPLISNRPDEAKWISKEERDYLNRVISSEQAVIAETNKQKNVTSYKQLLKSVDMWKLIFIYFTYQVGNYGYVMWLPSITKELTKSGMGMVGLLNALPFIAAFAGLCIVGMLSDKSPNRRKFTVFCLAGTALFLLLSTQMKGNIWVSFGMLVCTGFFLKPAFSMFWTLPPLLFPSDVVGGARGMINALGNLGGLVGPWIVGIIIAQTNNFTIGIYVMTTVLFLSAIITATLPSATSQPLNQVVKEPKGGGNV